MKRGFLALGILVVFLALTGCASVDRSPQVAIQTYNASQLVTEYTKTGTFYSPFGIHVGMPSLEELRAPGYKASMDRGLGTNDVLFINESLRVRGAAGWSWTFNWMTVFMVNFGDYEYHVTVISR